MLYERWRHVAREYRNELALCDFATGRQWTFAQLDEAAAEDRTEDGSIVFPRGNDAAFVLAVLRAWRRGRITCPVEASQATPDVANLPAGVAHLKLTSATTGPAKLIAFTAGQLEADADNIVATMGLRRDWPNVGFISLAHSYGFSNLVTPLLLHGIPLILSHSPLPEVLRSIGQSFPNITVPAVPALWRAWTDARAIPASLRLSISAGAPLPLALEQATFEVFGLKLHNFYGASECGGIAYDANAVPRGDAACVGAPLRNVSVAVNASGCLEVRGPSVGQGYLEEPSPALRDGTYVTSDLAEIVDGRIFLRGRASERINVAGRKVSPETIERVLSAHPAVRECLVFGVEDFEAQRGEIIVACVACRNGTTAGELRQFVARQSEPWHAPREIWFVDALEANARGKLSRADWRTRFLRERARRSG